MRKSSMLSLPVLLLVNCVGADLNHSTMQMDPTMIGLPTPVEYKTDVTVIRVHEDASIDYYIKKKVYTLPDGTIKNVYELHGNCYFRDKYLRDVTISECQIGLYYKETQIDVMVQSLMVSPQMQKALDQVHQNGQPITLDSDTLDFTCQDGIKSGLYSYEVRYDAVKQCHSNASKSSVKLSRSALYFEKSDEFVNADVQLHWMREFETLNLSSSSSLEEDIVIKPNTKLNVVMSFDKKGNYPMYTGYQMDIKDPQQENNESKSGKQETEEQDNGGGQNLQINADGDLVLIISQKAANLVTSLLAFTGILTFIS